MQSQPQKRVNALIELLKTMDKIHLKDAAQLLAVSEMTIRRDLNHLPTSLTVLGGYIVNQARHSIATYFVSDQQDKQVKEKLHIAKLVSQLVSENDTIFFDCGTTMPFIIDAIDDQIAFTAICYSFNAFLALQHKPNCKIILCGGNYHSNNAIFTSINQHNQLDSICPNKAFISAAGIDFTQGVTCYNFDELSMKHKAIQKSSTNILIADHTKFNQIKPALIGDLSLFNLVITDKAPKSQYLAYFKENNIGLMY